MKINIEKLKKKLETYEVYVEHVSKGETKVLFRNPLNSYACDEWGLMGFTAPIHVYNDYIVFHRDVLKGKNRESIITKAYLVTKNSEEFDIENYEHIWETVEAWQKEVVENDEQCRLQRINEEWGYE